MPSGPHAAPSGQPGHHRTAPPRSPGGGRPGPHPAPRERGGHHRAEPPWTLRPPADTARRAPVSPHRRRTQSAFPAASTTPPSRLTGKMHRAQNPGLSGAAASATAHTDGGPQPPGTPRCRRPLWRRTRGPGAATAAPPHADRRPPAAATAAAGRAPHKDGRAERLRRSRERCHTQRWRRQALAPPCPPARRRRLPCVKMADADS